MKIRLVRSNYKEEPPVAFRFKAEPVHCGVLLPAVGVGNALMVTLVVAVAIHPLASVTVTVYVPEAPVVTLVIDGFGWFEVKPFGPVQL